MKVYYNQVQIDVDRVTQFFELSFRIFIGKSDKELFRNEIYDIYNKDYYKNFLEWKVGIRNGILSCYIPSELNEQYVPHQIADVYDVSDFFFENYEPSIPFVEEKEEDEKESEKEDEKEGEKEDEREDEGLVSSDTSDISSPSDDSNTFLNNNLIYVILFIGLILNW